MGGGSRSKPRMPPLPGTRGRGLRAGLLLGIVLAAGAHAETQYVIDRLLIGIHEDKALTSAIIKVVPTGTPLEILERQGDFARVRTPDDVTGWVDANYLMTDKPAQVTLLELGAKQQEVEETLSESRGELAAARDELATARDELGAAHGELAAAREKIAALEARAAQAETQIEVAGAELQALRAAPPPEDPSSGQPASEEAIPDPVPPPMPSEALREIERVAEENRRLKDQIAELNASLGGTRVEAPAVELPRTVVPAPMAGLLAEWQWLLAGSVLLLVFASGGYLVDYGVRRRHGGFRV